MDEIPVYVIGNFSVSDRDTCRIYEQGFFPLLKKHGGSFITFDDEPRALEGEMKLTGRVVVFQFPSQAAADAWYNDPEYQALSGHRRAGTELNFLTLVHGQPPR